MVSSARASICMLAQNHCKITLNTSKNILTGDERGHHRKNAFRKKDVHCDGFCRDGRVICESGEQKSSDTIDS